MVKYILAIDFGTSNTKYLIMKIENDNIVIVEKNRILFDDVKSLEEKFEKILKDKNIDILNQLEIVITGGYSINIGDQFLGVDVHKIPEYMATAYGALLLTKEDKAIIVSMGTGTCYLYSDLLEVRHIGGTGLGAGYIFGIGRKIYNVDNISEMFDKAKNGDTNNTDKFVKDLTGKELFDLGADLTVSNLTNANNETKDDDFVLSLYNAMCQNIGIEAIFVRGIIIKEKKLDKNELPIIFTGTIVKYQLIKDLLNKIAKDLNEKFIYVEDCTYTTVIGAYEYYLLRERKNY